MFEMFVQGDRGPDRAQGGLGLGLLWPERSPRCTEARSAPRATAPVVAASSPCGCPGRPPPSNRRRRRYAPHPRRTAVRTEGVFSWWTTIVMARRCSRRCSPRPATKSGSPPIRRKRAGAGGHLSPAGRDPRRRVAGDGRLRAGTGAPARLGGVAPILIAAVTGYGQTPRQAAQRRGRLQLAPRQAGQRRDDRALPRRRARALTVGRFVHRSPVANGSSVDP